MVKRLFFERFYIDCCDRSFWTGGERIALPPKLFAVLEYLVRNHERLVTKQELEGGWIVPIKDSWLASKLNFTHTTP